MSQNKINSFFISVDNPKKRKLVGEENICSDTAKDQARQFGFTVDSWMFGLVWQPVYLHPAVADFGNLDNPIPYTLTVQRTLVSRSKRLLLSETEAF